MPKLLKFIRDDSFVRFRREMKVHDGIENHDITAHEAPLKSFDKALQALSDVVANVMDVGQDYKKGMVIRSVSISHTKAGTRSVAIAFTKHINATEGVHPMDTPFFQIDDSSTNEEGRKQVSKKHAELVSAAIEEAEAYAEGKRAQQMLPLDDGKSEKSEPAGGDLLDFKGGKAGQPATPPAADPKPKK